jgi:poly(3-hydroxybutyrate) depolymerase
MASRARLLGRSGFGWGGLGGRCFGWRTAIAEGMAYGMDSAATTPMIYQFYQAQADVLAPIRALAQAGSGMLRQFDFGALTPPLLRHAAAWFDMVAESRLTHHRPPFGIETVQMGNTTVGVTEQAADDTPFGTLLRFRKEAAVRQPRVLLVAPMSGHFATLLRGTVRTMLPEHDVYITDWKNARDVGLEHGGFGVDAFVAHLIRFLEVMGPGSHLVAVCQPAVAALAAGAVMAARGNRAQPRSMTLMAGPIDTRVKPTQVNLTAQGRSIEWFERNVIGTVPCRYNGAGRRVYPGFLQLSAFVSMNLDRHLDAHLGQFRALVSGNDEAAAAHRRFYNEYCAVMDLPAEFYLETVQRVFQDHDLPLGRFTYQGEVVRPAAIRRTAILTVEGERDDICANGQTMAALDLCSGVPISMRRHHLQTGVGHYGVFAGKRWVAEIYPLVREMIQATS